MTTKVGGIVLCGGKSSRMGRPKAWLPFGSQPMLVRVISILSEVVSPIVVVAASGQDLPPLPSDVRIIRDERPEQGPLEGLRVGLTAIAPFAAAAFVTSCDVPLLRPSFVRQMIAALRTEDSIAVPQEANFHHPLAAVYRTSIVPEIECLLADERRRPVFLFDRVATRAVPVDQLRIVDPELDSLRNLNHPEDYQSALERAGLPPEPNVDGRASHP